MAESNTSLRDFAVEAGEAKALYGLEFAALGAAAVRPEILGDPRLMDVYADPAMIVAMNVAQNTYTIEQGEAS